MILSPLIFLDVVVGSQRQDTALVEIKNPSFLNYGKHSY